MEVVEHSADVFGSLWAIVLEDSEVVVAVAEVVGLFTGIVDDGEPKAVAPELDCFVDIRCAHADVDECSRHWDLLEEAFSVPAVALGALAGQAGKATLAGYR